MASGTGSACMAREPTGGRGLREKSSLPLAAREKTQPPAVYSRKNEKIFEIAIHPLQPPIRSPPAEGGAKAEQCWCFAQRSRTAWTLCPSSFRRRRSGWGRGFRRALRKKAEAEAQGHQSPEGQALGTTQVVKIEQVRDMLGNLELGFGLCCGGRGKRLLGGGFQRWMVVGRSHP